MENEFCWNCGIKIIPEVNQSIIEEDLCEDCAYEMYGIDIPEKPLDFHEHKEHELPEVVESEGFTYEDYEEECRRDNPIEYLP